MRPAALAGVKEAAKTSRPPSPCIKVCRISLRDAQCVGCHRTRDEIAVWGSATDEEKEIVWEALDARRRAKDAAAGFKSDH